MSQLDQVQIVYVAAEDRLLMRLATGANEEFRCWLTRRFVKVLRPHLVDHLSRQTPIQTQASTAARRELLGFEHERAVRGADFDTPFKEADKALPLGAQPLLLTRFTLRPGQGTLTLLSRVPERGAGIDLALLAHLMHSIRARLDKALAASDWALETVLPQPPGEARAPSSTLN